MYKHEVTYKTAKTIKPYEVRFGGYDITVPVGSLVSNKTAIGYDDTHRFWEDWHSYVQKLTGFSDSMLAHDLTYYGLDIPKDYCSPWEESK